MTTDLGPESTLAVVAEAVSRNLPDEWNRTPDLAVVLAADDTVTVQGLPLPDQFWQNRHPVDVINRLTVLMAIDPMTPPPPDLGEVVGIMACSEGYVARVPEDADPKEVQAFTEWCDKGHSVADHPWGRESRLIHAIGFDGSLHQVQHVRGTREHLTESFAHFDDWPSGRLVGALRHFAAAVHQAVHA